VFSNSSWRGSLCGYFYTAEHPAILAWHWLDSGSRFEWTVYGTSSGVIIHHMGDVDPGKAACLIVSDVAERLVTHLLESPLVACHLRKSHRC